MSGVKFIFLGRNNSYRVLCGRPALGQDSHNGRLSSSWRGEGWLGPEGSSLVTPQVIILNTVQWVYTWLLRGSIRRECITPAGVGLERRSITFLHLCLMLLSKAAEGSINSPGGCSTLLTPTEPTFQPVNHLRLFLMDSL